VGNSFLLSIVLWKINIKAKNNENKLKEKANSFLLTKEIFDPNSDASRVQKMPQGVKNSAPSAF
jgi:hypothetical protein